MRQHPSPDETAWLELLKNSQNTLAHTIDSSELKLIPKWEIRYLLWASVFVNQAASGFLILQNAHSYDAAKLLVRPMLEVIMAAQAVQNKRGFLFRKIYTEFREFCKSDPNATQALMDATVQKYVKAFKDYDKSYPCEQKQVPMDYTAKVAGMEDQYNVYYRIYCKYTHGAQIAVTGALNEVTDLADTPIVVELVLRTLGLLQKHTSEKVPQLVSLREQYKILFQRVKWINLPDSTK